MFRRLCFKAAGLAVAIVLGTFPVTAGTPEQVEHGAYLARAGDCISCHTAGGKDAPAYAGGLAISTPYGNLISPNITPDLETGIGTWTAEDFWRTIHFGVNKRGDPLYPAMPYVFFTKVTRDDSDAIFAYLRTLKPVRHEVDINQLRWPYDMRFAAMSSWQTLYFTPGPFNPNPAKSPAWNRGAYIVEGLGHCGACHTPRNFMGAIEPSERFTGAEIGSWFAPNITPNLRHGIGQYSLAELAQFFKEGVMTRKVEEFSNGENVYGFSSHQTVEQLPTAVGPMAEAWHNSLRFLTDEDAKAMATYLLSLPAATSPTTAEEPTVQPYKLSVGARLFLENCAGCHMPNGEGGAGAAPPLAGNPMVTAPSPDNLLSMVLGGQGAQHKTEAMPSFRTEFTNGEVAAVLNYVRSAWGNAAPPVSLSQVAAFRKDYFPGKVPQ